VGRDYQLAIVKYKVVILKKVKEKLWIHY
jgi:hypothetical protein